MQMHFEWDPKKAVSNLRKHKVSFAEAAEAFRDPLAITVPDDEHTEQEERWITLGQGNNRRLVVVIHTWRDDEDSSDIVHVRIVSAREATAHELQQYEG